MAKREPLVQVPMICSMLILWNAFMAVKVRSAKVLTLTVKNCAAISAVLMMRLAMLVAAAMAPLVLLANARLLVLPLATNP